MNVATRKALSLTYGIACHGLFVAAVAMMIWQMYFGMSRSFGTLTAPWSIAANGLLIAQFPLAHSLLLTGRGRAALARLAPASVGRDMAPTSYVIVASLQTLLLFSLWSPSGVVWWQAEGAWRIVFGVLYLASWLLLGRAIADAGMGLQTGAIGWLGVYRGARPAYPPMPQKGLFRFSRQPIYFAFTMTLWTVPVWTPDQLAVALTLTAYCLAGPMFKEQRFARMFGAAFESYRQNRSYFVPMPEPIARNDLSIYDQYAEQWWTGGVRWLRTLQNLVPARLSHFDTQIDWRGKKVLDLGCGGGFLAEALARRGAEVTGVDPAAGAIAIAMHHAKGEGLTIDYRVGVGENLLLADASLDAVVCVDVLEHVEDVARVIAEVHRVLKPGGVFFFDTINRTLLARLVVVHLAEDVLRLLPRGTHDPAKFITPAELDTQLRRANFQVFPPVGLGPRSLTRRLDFTFGRLPVTSILYMSHAIRD
jgi:ubiquinone biosynthesis O-methyltransferase